MGKVALFVPDLVGGGAERQMVRLANALHMQGHDVHFIVAKKGMVYKAELNIGIKYKQFGKSKTMYSLFELTAYIKECDITSLLSTLVHSNLISIMVGFFVEEKVCCVVREANCPTKNLSTKGFFSRNIHKILIRLLYPFATQVIAVSTDVASDLKKNYGIKSVDVIYNPVLDKEVGAGAFGAVNSSYKGKYGAFILGVGRLTHQKGFDILINGFQDIRKNGGDYNLVILGEGELREDLEALVKKLKLEPYVFMPGFVENPFEYMVRSELFILSSRWEGLPGVLIQAMALNCNVLSAKCEGGSSEILRGNDLRLFDVGNVLDLSQKANQLLQQKEGAIIYDDLDRFHVTSVIYKYIKVLKL